MTSFLRSTLALRSTMLALMLATALAAPVSHLRGLQEITTQPVDLGTADTFAILTKSGISSVAPSEITGDIGVSPIAATGMTGFSLTLDPSGQFSTSAQVTGKCFAVDYAAPTPDKMRKAISDMEAAYTDAAGRPVVAANLNRKGGLIDGETFESGVYRWSSEVKFEIEIFISGDEDDVFIFQTSSNVNVGNSAKVTLVPKTTTVAGIKVFTGNPPKASNIFWQVAGKIDAGINSHLEGTFLVQTHSAFRSGSRLNGRALAQTAVTLIDTTIYLE